MKDYYKVHCGCLRSNGLRFYTQYDRSHSRGLALIVVMVGLIHDPPNRRGLSHLTEHVICAEPKAHTAQQVESIMARTLGSESALITTSKTVTTYVRILLLKQRLKTGLVVCMTTNSWITLKNAPLVLLTRSLITSLMET